MWGGAKYAIHGGAGRLKFLLWKVKKITPIWIHLCFIPLPGPFPSSGQIPSGSFSCQGGLVTRARLDQVPPSWSKSLIPYPTSIAKPMIRYCAPWGFILDSVLSAISSPVLSPDIPQITRWQNIPLRPLINAKKSACDKTCIFSHSFNRQPKPMEIPEPTGPYAMPRSTPITDAHTAWLSQWRRARGALPVSPFFPVSLYKNWIYKSSSQIMKPGARFCCRSFKALFPGALDRWKQNFRKINVHEEHRYFPSLFLLESKKNIRPFPIW